MQLLVLFIVHVLLMAAVPVALAARRGPLTTPLLYSYLAVTLFIGGFWSAVYRFPLTESIVIGAGSIAHAAFLFTVLVLLVTTRDVVAIRDVIKLVVLTTAFKVVFILLVTRTLRSGEVVVPFGARPELFDSSLRVVLAGSVLIIAELIALVVVIERIKTSPNSSINPIWYPAVFAAILAFDGVLFPVLYDPTTTDLANTIQRDVVGRLMVAGAFCIPVLAYLMLFRDRLTLYEAQTLHMRGLFRGPNLELVREIERQERELEYQATHDDLTGLVNRAEMLRRIDEALGRSGVGRSRCLAVMFLDLDDFKVVNDAHGHAAGDEVLIASAERIRSCLREGDLAARLGGDEFTVLVTDVADAHDATAVARRILERLTEPLQVTADSTATIHASIGMAFADDRSTHSAEVLIRNADLAMYRAKELGKDRLEVFTEDLHRRAQARAELATEISSGIDRGEFVTLYQPQVELYSGRVIGVEALVRWLHPRRGLLAPDTFISQAENSSAIIDLGEQVMDQACSDAVEWGRAGGPPLDMSVNVSARQLRDPALVPQVTEALRRSGLDPHLLTIEITESSVMSDVHRSVRTIEELKSLGVKISIDDFGTGFSSLAYLHQLPVDMLKIDKSFVDRICDEKVSSGGPLVASIIGLGNLLDLTVVAEGIENAEQCDALVQLGCQVGQGFHFAPAVTADQISGFMIESPRPRACTPLQV